MKKITLLLIAIIMLAACNKNNQTQPNTNQQNNNPLAPTSQNATITYKAILNRMVPGHFLKKYMNVYGSHPYPLPPYTQTSWYTLTDTAYVTTSQYSFITADSVYISGVYQPFQYSFAYNIEQIQGDTNQVLTTDSIRLQILINNVIQADTIYSQMFTGSIQCVK